MNAAPPTGTIVFLFTDIEGSTRIYQAYPERMPEILARHNAILSEAIQTQRGYIFQIIGDAFCAAFYTARDGLAAALAAQRVLMAETWPERGVVRVRMGLHVGSADLDLENNQYLQYSGYGTLARVQRIMSAAHGGQILISAAAHALLIDDLPVGTSLRDLGSFELKGLVQPERLYQVITPDLPQDFPPLRTSGRTPTNLPIRLSSFIGREKEIVEVKNALSIARLVTLTGSGGVGKTRLAIRVAGELLDAYPDGVWLCELAPISDPELVSLMVARSVGLRADDSGGMDDLLADYLRDKSCLLVVDNCEHLIETCAQLVEKLLYTAPNIHILASSREALGITGERAYRVPSLSLPEKNASLEKVSVGSDAARLFVERASTALPGFHVTETNAPAIVQICRRLDGIPLAIELAAARVNVLQVDQIAARLADVFRLLTGGSRTALPRQQTLQASIDWSYQFLSTPERLLLQRLSVFAGGWRLDAAEAVCGFAEVEPTAVLDLLTQLVNKSLVSVERQQGAETRYRLLETIRQYARLKLFEAGEGATLRNRHLDYYLWLAQQGEPKLYGRDQVEWIERLDAEMDNFWAALDWAQESDPAVDGGEVGLAGLRLTAALGWFFSLHGILGEGYTRLVTAVELSAGMQTSLRAKLLAGAGWLAIMTGVNEQVEPYVNESIALSRQLGDWAAIAFPTATLGVLAYRYNDFERAAELGKESLSRYERAGNRWGMRHVYGLLGYTAEAQGDITQAEAYYQRSLDLSREIEDQDGLGWTLFLFGNLSVTKGEYEQAMKYYREALAICLQVKNRPVNSWVVGAMAELTTLQGSYDLAQAYLLENLELYRSMGDRVAVSIAYSDLGHCALKIKDYSRAAANCIQGLRLATELRHPYAIAHNLAEFGLLALAEGKIEQAVRYFAASEATHATHLSDIRLTIHRDIQEALDALKARLGESGFQEAWMAGKVWTVKEACAAAMNDYII